MNRMTSLTYTFLPRLKTKVADINLLESSRNNFHILTELQGFMLKLSQSEAPSFISTVVLDLKILLDQAIKLYPLKGIFLDVLGRKSLLYPNNNICCLSLN